MNEEKLKGVDISEMNGDINFNLLKDEVDFVMIRATWGRYKVDRNFVKNVTGCIENEIPFGIYYYSYALNIEQADEEFKHLMEVITPYKDNISYPIIIDMEDSDGYKVKNGFPSNEVLSKICKNFCVEVNARGFVGGIYASADWYKTKLNIGLKPYLKWIAWWNTDEKNIDKKEYKMWQYSSKGKVKGIETNVDLNYSYIDFKKLTEYLKNVEKISFIKLKTGLEDLTIQFMSCYKHGQDLINKIYVRLKKAPASKSEKEIKEIIKEEYNLEDKTIVFLSNYIYDEPLFLKLYRAICEEE